MKYSSHVGRRYSDISFSSLPTSAFIPHNITGKIVHRCEYTRNPKPIRSPSDEAALYTIRFRFNDFSSSYPILQRTDISPRWYVCYYEN
ncbi:MAG TPA: hypothetical protein PLH76_08180, partial [Rectinema sp.]|nr:hypothetical protein [Rectinema sp.]